MTSDALLKALSARHADDVFVPECKDGATQTRSHKRLDAWVLRRTWSPVTTIGYEIKVSRSDWRRDQKLDVYAGLCHLLIVVAPKDVVPLEELPVGVGLLEPVGDGSRLVMRRKPTRREIDVPVSLLLYVLMSRAAIQCERPTQDYREHARKWRVQELTEWVSKREERRSLSYAVSQKIREQFDAQELRLSELESQVAQLADVRKRIIELGFDPSQPTNFWRVREQLNAIGKAIPQDLVWDVQRQAKSLERLATRLEDLRRPKPDTEQ